jgi:DNA repair protein RadC
MYSPKCPPRPLQVQLLGHLQVIFGTQAQEIFDGCNGCSNTLVDQLRHKSGPEWEVLRAARGVQELALLEMASAGPLMNSPAATENFLKNYLAGRPYEVFLLMHLDQRHRLLAVEELFRGTVAEAQVHPREVLRSILEHNSAAILICHNHTSGVAQPSHADELITLRIRELASQAEVRVLDHIIVAGNNTFSFASRGLL